MAGTLSVQKIQGLASSATPTPIEIASGHVLQAPGHVLQTKSAAFTDTMALSVDTRTDITNLSLDITPSSTSSKILVLANVCYGGSNNNLYGSGFLVRDSTDIGVGTTATGSRQNVSFGMDFGNGSLNEYKLRTASGMFLDSPSTTSSVTYKVQVRHNVNGTMYINRSGQDSNADYGCRGISTLTIMEIAQ